MPTLTAVAEPTFGRVRLEVDFSDTPAVTYVHVHRSLDNTPLHGSDPVVRMHGVTADLVDAFGTWTLKRTSGGRAVFYDTELPLDTNVWYRMDSSQAISAAFADAGPVSVASSGTIWLKDPVRPAHDVQASVVGRDFDPTCVPTSGVIIVGFDASQYAGAGGRFEVEDSTYPTVVSRPRKSFTSTMSLVTKLITDRDRVRTLLGSGGVLLVQTPAAWGYGDMYIDIGDTTETRLARDHRKPWRAWQLPFAVTQRPAGLQFGVDAARWMDLCDVYATWGAIETAGKTWLDVLQREAG